jgi:hypothetical protein
MVRRARRGNVAKSGYEQKTRQYGNVDRPRHAVTGSSVGWTQAHPVPPGDVDGGIEEPRGEHDRQMRAPIDTYLDLLFGDIDGGGHVDEVAEESNGGNSGLSNRALCSVRARRFEFSHSLGQFRPSSTAAQSSRDRPLDTPSQIRQNRPLDELFLGACWPAGLES